MRNKPERRKTVQFLLLFLLAAYFVLLAAMFLMQRRLMYFPERNHALPSAFALGHMEEAHFTSGDGTPLTGWYAPSQNGVTILYFHGNAGFLGHRAEKFNAFASRGYGVLALSYRGFGRSEGSPTESGLYLDARAAYRQATEAYGLPPERLVLYGESLGTGVAVELAAHHPVGAVVLEAPYTSTVARAAEIYAFIPVRWLMHDRFDTLSRIGQVKAPLLILHGTKDRIIPVAHGRAVHAAAGKPKEAIWFDGVGHTDFPLAAVTDAMDAFLERHGVTPSSLAPQTARP